MLEDFRANILKVGVHMNRSEIWSIIKRELLGLLWIGNTTRELTTLNESPRLVGDCVYPSTNSSLQISIFQIHQIFNISYFPQFNLFFEKKSLFTKMPKNHPKIYTKPPNGGYGYKHRDFALLKTKAVLRDVKTAFTCTPALKVLAKEDTLLRTHCCRHKCFVWHTKIVSDFVQKHFVTATNVSQFAQHGNTTFILCPTCLRAQETSWATMARFILETDDPSRWIIHGEGSSV